ncbi:MAG TPA: flavin reductase family protein [Candidatus Marinimicrobia bacterium]|jgi:flavin reductase (DIM6/NTAB) family NADH-FMN oxidoreductase RutF|nr:flavin reductase family protein [Candidatus Neomarinimicrobiota bacterium]
MIYDPTEHPLLETHKLMIGSIVPRPIAFVSTLSKDGLENLAPFSYFNGICSNPPSIMFCPARRGYDGKTKDTLNNIRDTEEFAVNIVSEDFAEQMVSTSTDFEPEVNEFEVSGLTPEPCQKIAPPKVAEAKISFECKLNKIIPVGNEGPGGGFVIIGTIVLFHIDDDVYEDGYINLGKLRPIGRLAGNMYTRTTDKLEIIRKIKPD